MTFDTLREAIGRACKKLSGLRVQSFAVALETFTTDQIAAKDAAHAFSESYILSTYAFTGYKQKTNEPDVEIESIEVYTNEDIDEVSAALEVGAAYGEGTNSARGLVNTPGNMLTASDMADYAREMAITYDFEVEILDKAEMEKLGMGALLAVNKGSAEPPFMIVLKYQGKEEWTDVIGLVGKGVTFDTGGYSLKPKDGIVGMKMDMGGAAAVFGAMEIVGKLRPRTKRRRSYSSNR